MRQGLVATLLLAGGIVSAGCESLPEGAFGEIGKTVLGDVMGTAAASASAEMVRETADSMCSSGNAMCRNLTMVAMAGFTKSFIEQLTERDVRQINEARQLSIDTGETQEWENPQSGASGRVESAPAEPRAPAPTPVKVKKDQIESLPMMDAVGEPYVVTAAGGANVRGGPGTRYAIVDKLASDERVRAIGKVRDDDWYLVGRGNLGIGYVSGGLVSRWQAQSDQPLDEALTAAAPESAGQEVAEVKIDMAAECFTTKQTVTLANGKTEEASVTSCRTPNGWAQV